MNSDSERAFGTLRNTEIVNRRLAADRYARHKLFLAANTVYYDALCENRSLDLLQELKVKYAPYPLKAPKSKFAQGVQGVMGCYAYVLSSCLALVQL